MFEEKLIRQVRGGLLGIQLGTKSFTEVKNRLLMLKKYNKPMYEDLLEKYLTLVNTMDMTETVENMA
jgi:RNA:NAD 2'-phosphotransferase (TPT1/KptA family)